MVSEEIIEEVIGFFESDEEAYVEALARIMDSQPALLAFLSQESIDILLEDEKDILWYIILVIYTSIERSGADHVKVTDTMLGEKEELNWEIYQNQPRGTVREKVTVFFENYHQEDLLAFVEDTLELDDSSPITAVGREVIFISSKSILDTILT